MSREIEFCKHYAVGLLCFVDFKHFIKFAKRWRFTEFPLTMQESVELELKQFEITTPDTIIIEVTTQGDKPV
jgi:hypothetical protein